MRITIDADKCCGSGQCVLAAERVFDQDDDGIVILLDGEPDESQRHAVTRAAALCPTAVIRVEG